MIENNSLHLLHPLLDKLAAHSEELLARWCQAYRGQSRNGRALSETEFLSVMPQVVRHGVAALKSHDLELFASLGKALGERLAAHGVAFFEVVLCLQVGQESVEALWPDEFSPAVERVFSRLCHLHAMVVAEGYTRAEHGALLHPEANADSADGRPEPARRDGFHGLLGASPVMQRVYDRIEAAGRTRGVIFIVGESGTGKELVARAIHQAAGNPDAPFVAVNCPAIPRDLIESELFGHQRGAFSGANGDHPGLFRAAEGGTLFLDEVTEMDPATQAKVLRALQERAVRPVGSVAEVPVNARVIASTNRRPEQAVQAGRLREDLYYRLQANIIELPPLRERVEDIPLLTAHFIRTWNARAGRAVPVVGIAQEAMAALLNHAWPGNVRELSNAIESAVTFGRHARIHHADLPDGIRQRPPKFAPPPILRMDVRGTSEASARGPAAEAPKTFDEGERELIERALRMAGHNKTYAAELLRISRKKLYARLVKYGLANRARRARSLATPDCLA